jgi:2-aminoadipate transaminase
MENPAAREIFKMLDLPGVISFAGGFPSNDSLPAREMEMLAGEILARDGTGVLQYGPVAGYGPLLENISAWLQKSKKITAAPAEVLITSGSQQALDLIGKLCLEEGDLVAVEEPTYLTALQTFNSYRVRFLPIPCDGEGMQVDVLEKSLAACRPKFVYTVATFQNPTGVSLGVDRRERLLRLAEEHGFHLIEDNAYGDLCYEGEEPPALKSLDRKGRVVYLGSFSKIISPGLRVGYMVADRETRAKAAVVKQVLDVHTSNLSQRIVCEFLSRGCLEPHLENIRAGYLRKRDAMLEALKRHLPRQAEWTRPRGGFFIWVRLPGAFDSGKALPEAILRGMAFVPGKAFFTRDGGQNSLRLSFSGSTPEQIHRGIEILGGLIRDYGW